MALQLGALRDALIDAGLGAIETRLTVLTWMVASAIALGATAAAPALWLLLRVAGKVGAL